MPVLVPRRTGYWADFQATGQIVLAAARAAGDHTTLGWAHTILGRYCTFVGAHGQDSAHLTQAVEHFRLAGDPSGQAHALLFASHACSWGGRDDWSQAASLAERALSLYRQTHDRTGQAWVLHALAQSHARLGNYQLARDYAQQGLELAAKATDPTSLVLAWSVLGLVHSRAGEHPEAIGSYQRALDLAGQWTTPLGRRLLADILADYGDARQAAGDLPAARQAWQQALQIRDDLRLPDTRRFRARLQQASTSTRQADRLACPGRGFLGWRRWLSAASLAGGHPRWPRPPCQAGLVTAVRSVAVSGGTAANAQRAALRGHRKPVTCRNIASTPGAGTVICTGPGVRAPAPRHRTGLGCGPRTAGVPGW